MRSCFLLLFAFLASAQPPDPCAGHHKPVQIAQGAYLDHPVVEITESERKAGVCIDWKSHPDYNPGDWKVDFGTVQTSPCYDPLHPGQKKSVFQNNDGPCLINGQSINTMPSCKDGDPNTTVCFKYSLTANGKTRDPQVIVDSTMTVNHLGTKPKR